MKNEETIILLFGNDYQRKITRTIEKTVVYSSDYSLFVLKFNNPDSVPDHLPCLPLFQSWE